MQTFIEEQYEYSNGNRTKITAYLWRSNQEKKLLGVTTMKHDDKRNPYKTIIDNGIVVDENKWSW